MSSAETKIIENITKSNLDIQNQRLRLFAKVNITTKLKILQYQKQLFHQLKSVHNDVDNAVVTLSSLIIAIDRVVKELDIVNLNAMKLKVQPNKVKQKRQKLLDLWAIVRTLKNEQNMSFRLIAKYFQKYNKFEISHSMIQQMWEKIEKIGEKSDIK